jgi:integrase
MSTKRRSRGTGCVRPRPKGQTAIWEIRISLGVSDGGKRKVITSTFRGSKTEAERDLRRRLHDIDEGSHVDPSKLTVGEFLIQWLDHAKHKVSAKSFERYSGIVHQHVIPHLGAVKLQKLQVLNLTQLYAALMDSEGDARTLSASSVGYVHRVMYQALKQGVLWKYLSSNPAGLVQPPRAEVEPVEILDAQTVSSVLQTLRGWPVHPIAVVALGTGMRRGEILALRWRDVDLARNDRAQISVERSLEQTKARGLRFKAPKTKHSRRKISLPDYVRDELRAHWKATQEARLQWGVGKSAAEDLVFAMPDSEPRNPNSVSSEWRRLLRLNKLPAVRFHSLRHTHASHLIANGMDVLTISRRLGHSSPTVTLNIYGHLFPDADDRAAKALDAAFSVAQTENL